MSAQLISGKILAAQMKESVAKDVAALKEKGVHARLAVIIVGDRKSVV